MDKHRLEGIKQSFQGHLDLTRWFAPYGCFRKDFELSCTIAHALGIKYSAGCTTSHGGWVYQHQKGGLYQDRGPVYHTYVSTSPPPPKGWFLLV